MELVELSNDLEDREFIRRLFRNRVRITRLLQSFPPILPSGWSADDVMFALEDEWRRYDRRQADSED